MNNFRDWKNVDTSHGSDKPDALVVVGTVLMAIAFVLALLVGGLK